MDIIFAWVIIGLGLLEVFLAIWIFQKHPSSHSHQFFSLFSLGLAGWTLCSGIEVIIADSFSINLWDRILFFSAYAASFFLFQFSQHYPVPNAQKMLGVLSFVLLVIVSILLFFTDLIIAEPVELDTANIQSLHWLYMLGFLINWISALVLLFKSRLKVSGSLKQQVSFLGFGILCGSFVGIITSFVMPYQSFFPPISQLWPPGIAFVIFIASVKVMRIAYYNHSSN